MQICGRAVDHTQRELQPHGTPAFPCAGYDSHYQQGIEDQVPWHWHVEMEVIAVVSGQLRVQVPGHSLHLGQGEGAFFSANLLHRVDAATDCHAHTLVFHPRLVTGGEDTVFYRQYVAPLIDASAARAVPLTVPEYQTVELAFAALLGRGEGWEFEAREQLSKLCLALKRRLVVGQSAAPSRDMARLQAMLAFIHRNFSERITLEQVARCANISTRECLRCFERMAGVSPMQYLAGYRVAQAAQLLKEGDMGIAQISTDCGFDSPSHFAQVFKRHYQASPRAYRKSAQAPR